MSIICVINMNMIFFIMTFIKFHFFFILITSQIFHLLRKYLHD